MQRLTTSKWLRILFYIFLIVVLVIQTYPMFWVLMSSFKTKDDMAFLEAYSMPSSLYLGNYITALFESNLIRYFLNSVIVAVGTLVGIVILSAPAAYAISKIQFKQNERLLSFFLLGMMIPIFACLIPMFQIYNAVGLRNTYLSLILPQIGFSLPMACLLYTSPSPRDA